MYIKQKPKKKLPPLVADRDYIHIRYTRNRVRVYDARLQRFENGDPYSTKISFIILAVSALLCLLSLIFIVWLEDVYGTTL